MMPLSMPQQAGYQATKDYNGHRQEGMGPADMTVYKGRRWSAANAYLRPALARGNVELRTSVMVDCLLFEGRKCIGVRYREGQQTTDVFAKKAVILSAGAIGSPAILQRSGIGPKEVLAKANVPVRADRPGVGANLQDHLEVYFEIACKQPITLYKHLNLFAKAWIGFQWLFFKKGLGASNQFESLGFIRSDKGISYPDIQYHFLPVAIRYDGKAPAEGHGFQLHVGPMRSKSRGHVHITSSDPQTAPEIRFNYLSHKDDMPEFRKALRLTREILAQPAFDPYRGCKFSREMRPHLMRRLMPLSAHMNLPITHAAHARWEIVMIRWPWSPLIHLSSALIIFIVLTALFSRVLPMAI